MVNAIHDNTLGIDCSGSTFGRLYPYVANTYFSNVSVSYQDAFVFSSGQYNNPFTLRLYVKSDSNATSFTSNYTGFTYQVLWG